VIEIASRARCALKYFVGNADGHLPPFRQLARGQEHVLAQWLELVALKIALQLIEQLRQVMGL
jgi:hypothetical protein